MSKYKLLIRITEYFSWKIRSLWYINWFVGAVGSNGEEKKEGATGRTAEEEAELEEARREAEEARKEKHRKMEVERENVRQVIRDKYNIKKKEEPPVLVPDDPSRVPAPFPFLVYPLIHNLRFYWSILRHFFSDRLFLRISLYQNYWWICF